MIFNWRCRTKGGSPIYRAEFQDMVLFAGRLKNGYFSEVMGKDGKTFYRKDDFTSLNRAREVAEDVALEDLRVRFS